jgi:flagellar biosynthesis anti-sigma factor FlgM
MKSVGNGTVVGAYQRMAVPAVGGAKPAAAPAAPASHEPAPHAAQVSISEEARHLSHAASGAGVDAAKVSDLKSKIQDGSYRVDSGRVASQILDRLM